MDKEIYYRYFKDNILPVILPFEKQRKNAVKKVIVTSILFFAVGIIFAGLFIFNSLYEMFNPLILPVLLFLMYAFILKSIISIIIEGKNYLKMLVEKVLPMFFEPAANFKRWPDNIDTEAVLETQLFPNFDTREDIYTFFGIYKNVNIKIANSRLTLPIKSSVKSFLFKGTTIQLEFPFSINNHVITISKNTAKVNRYKQINPHIEEMNKYLYVFAKKSEIDFLTEEFWNIIKRFGELYNAKSFRLSFKNDVLYIALEQKYPMQFGFLFRSLTNPKNFDDLIDRFIVIYDLVDYLLTTKKAS